MSRRVLGALVACVAVGGVVGPTAQAAPAPTVARAMTPAVAPALTSAPSAAGTFVSLAPARLLDTRSNLGGAGPVASGGVVHLSVLGRGGVPASGVSAVVLNVTVVYPKASGFVTVWPDGTPRPTASNLNFVAGQVVPNLVVAKVGANGAVALQNSSGGTVQLLADVSGYYLDGTPSVPGAFASLAPARLLDTRSNLGGPGPVPAGGVVHLNVLGRGGVPASGVSAVVLNVTVVYPKGSGFITVWPDGTTRPTASNLNFVAGRTVPNLVVVKVGANGAVALQNSSGGTVQLLADVAGYYLSGTPSVDGAFASLAPTRLLDTRSNLGGPGPVPAGGIVHLNVLGRGGVPSSGVSAVVLNVTVVYPKASGYVTVWPDGTPRPTASNLNFVAGQAVPNLVVAKVGPNGAVALQNSSGGTVQLLADVAGYFLPFPGPVTAAKATTASTTSMALSWTNPASGPFTGVVIRRADGTTPPADPTAGTDVTTTAGTTNSYTDTGLTAGNTYSYALFATDGSSWAPAANLTVTVGLLVWGAPQTIDPNSGSLQSISCPTATFCAAVDAFGSVLTFDGTSWAAPTKVDLRGYLVSVSCVSATFCVAGDSAGNVLTFDGTTWSAPTSVVGGVSLASVSCPTTSFCVAVDDAGAVVRYNGSSWTAPVAVDNGHSLTSVSCPSASFCVAVDDSGNEVTFTGTAWSAPRSIDPTIPLVSVSCPSASFCVAVDPAGNAVRYTGTTWAAPLSIDTGSLTAVSCTSSSFCVAIDDSGYALTFTGVAWSTPRGVDSAGLWSVSCATSSFCGAVDFNGAVVRFDGTRWDAPTTIAAPHGPLQAVSCPTASFCTAVDWAGKALTYDGTTWSAPVTVGAAPLTAVSCPTTTFCIAVDLGGDASTFNGSSWSTPVAIASTGSGLSAVSCPSTTFCAAVDDGGDAVTFNGTVWSAPKAIDANSSMMSVSCPTAAYCVAVDLSGNALTFNGAAWSAPKAVDGANGFLVSVSCPSTSFCMAADGAGSVVTLTGSTWHAPQLVDTASPDLSAVSCSSATACTLIDRGGRAMTFNGSTWSAPVVLETIYGQGALTGLSCPSPVSCVVVDSVLSAAIVGASA